MKAEYYINGSGLVLCDPCDGTYSIHAEGEEPDGYIESPFRTADQVRCWTRAEYADLPDWAREEIEDI